VTRRIPAPLPWLAGLLAIYLVAPLAVGIQQVWFADWRTVDVASHIHACAISLGSATTATAIIALGGIPLGYLLARLPGRAMAIVGFLVQLPLALPPLTSGILLLFLVGYDGRLGRLFGGALTDSFIGIVLAEVFVAAPFLIIAARSSFAAIDPVLEGVAATLGRGPIETFFRVSLPLARPTIAAGLLLSWLRAFGEFGATVMVAYHPYSLPVYTYVAFGAQGLPAMLPILLPTLLLAVLALALTQTLARQRQPSGTARLRRPIEAASNARRATPTKPMESKPALSLSLSKRLGNFQLAVDWTPQSHRLAILGPSGSGKSLTLRLIAGLDEADWATITIGGKDLAHLAAPEREIAYVPQNYGLFPHLTAAAQLDFPRGADPVMARRWIERLGLAGLQQRYPSELSLGQQQRVALARALVRPARLLLLDEPLSALDAPLRARLRSELLDLQREIQATTILVTHDPDEAALLADELLVLADGRVLQSGPTGEIFARPADEAVARLLGTENPAEGLTISEHQIAIGTDVVLDIAGPALPLNHRVGWSVPSSGIRICSNGRYQGCIEGFVPVGNGCRLELRLGDADITSLQSRSDWVKGSPCRLDIDPYGVRVWPRN
jgi:ABC-type Fe3+/spermidine/putrescine transport system ATPase subunit/ABC-type sulfate transport system permease component